MGAFTLIVHPDAEFRAEAARLVRKVLKDGSGDIVEASHATGARAVFFDRSVANCRLVLSEAVLPHDAATPIDRSGPAEGLDLLKAMRALEGGRTPMIIVTSDHGDATFAEEIGALSRARFVRGGADWSVDLALELAELMRRAEGEVRPRGLSLDLQLLRDWSWHLKGGGFEDSDPIAINQDILREVERCSKLILRDRDGANRADYLDMVRGYLSRLLFGSNPFDKLNSNLMRLIGKVGASNSRVRFVVDERTHALPLEALQDPESTHPAFWMLKAPIYRRYNRTGQGYPLFKDRASRTGKVNCLIVAADPAECDLGAPWNTPLESLAELEGEVTAIERVLREEKRSRGGIDRIEVFRAADHPGDAVEALAKLFDAGEQWHLVHFAGHAVRAGDTGGLVLGGAQGAVLDVERLSNLLAGTQFLYLSSCRSADAYFVMTFVERRLPAVLGFRWPVSDRKAASYGEHFYKALFSDTRNAKYLEYALMASKRQLHRDDPRDLTWAAPVLVMQVDDPEDEAYFLTTQPRAEARPGGDAIH